MKTGEAKNMKIRTYKLELSDADAKKITLLSGKYGLNISELLENFIGDLVDGTFTNGSDERMYADMELNRCYFSH